MPAGVTSPGIPSNGAFGYSATSDAPTYDPATHAGSGGGGGPSTASRVIRIVLDGGGGVITTGAKKVYVTVPFSGTITKARLLADVSGSIVIDVWKDTYANYPPTVADTIVAAAPPTLSAAQKSEDSTLTGWTTTVTAGDVIEVSVTSATTVTKVFLDLFVTATT